MVRLVPDQRLDLGAEPGSGPDPVPVCDGVEVVPILATLRVVAGPVGIEFRGQRVVRRRRIDADTRVVLDEPGAAQVVVAFEDLVRDPLAFGSDRGRDAGQPAADDGHVECVRQGCAPGQHRLRRLEAALFGEHRQELVAGCHPERQRNQPGEQVGVVGREFRPPVAAAQGRAEFTDDRRDRVRIRDAGHLRRIRDMRDRAGVPVENGRVAGDLREDCQQHSGIRALQMSGQQLRVQSVAVVTDQRCSGSECHGISLRALALRGPESGRAERERVAYPMRGGCGSGQ